jgi:tetrahydromethanopterin S-methyltransferase subunit F
MFSNDRNIETIAQLVEKIKEYASLKGESIRLNIVEKAVRIITIITITFIFTLLFLLALTYFSFCLAYAMAPAIGYVAAFAVIGTIYVLLFILCCIFRKTLIEKPLVKFLASILME